MPKRIDTLRDVHGPTDSAAGSGPRWTDLSTGTWRSAFDLARSRLDHGDTLLFSCPQKVCLSGDYGDMDILQDGVTLTAGVDIRPQLTMRRTDRRSRLTVSGRPVDLGQWDLLRAFNGILGAGYLVDVTPTKFMGLGLGSSGAASVILAMASAVGRGDSPSRHDLIVAAHEFETKLAGHLCGPQDHAASVLGGLHLIQFPSLDADRVRNLSAWPSLSFWVSDDRRAAHTVIPRVVARHSKEIWARKKATTQSLATAFGAGDIGEIIALMRAESGIQDTLGMLTPHQESAVTTVTGLGGAAKVSGAGGGGVLVVAAPDQAKQGIGAVLRAMDLRSIALHVDERGPVIQSAADRPGLP